MFSDEAHIAALDMALERLNNGEAVSGWWVHQIITEKLHERNQYSREMEMQALRFTAEKLINARGHHLRAHDLGILCGIRHGEGRELLRTLRDQVLWSSAIEGILLRCLEVQSQAA